MIVDGKGEVVFLEQLFQHVPLRFHRLASESSGAEFLPLLEEAPQLAFILADASPLLATDVGCDEFHALRLRVFPDAGDECLRRRVVEHGIAGFRADAHPHEKNLQRIESQRRCLVDGLEERALVPRPGMPGHDKAARRTQWQLVGSGCSADEQGRRGHMKENDAERPEHFNHGFHVISKVGYFAPSTSTLSISSAASVPMV